MIGRILPTLQGAVSGFMDGPPISVEEASAMSGVALASDIETWATSNADANGRVGVLDLVRTLDKYREVAQQSLPNYTEGSEGE